MKKWPILKYLICIWMVFVIFMAVTVPVQAAPLPYRSYAYDTDQYPFWIQSPYMPVTIIGQNLFSRDVDGQLQEEKGFSNPEDIFIDAEDYLYVADSDNNRIVKIDADGVIQKEFGTTGDDKLKSPEGVFVTNNGDVYVADTGHSRVVVFNPMGEIINILTAPEDVRLKSVLFVPVKVTVDDRGYIFIGLKGGNEGLVIMSPNGKFQGFFGRNQTELSFTEKIKRLIYTDKQIETNANDAAQSVSGVVAGKDGYIYTCTQNIKSGQIKKFNANGVDLFDNKDFQVKIPSRFSNGKPADSSIAAICVDSDGTIYSVDQNNGAVIIFDNQGVVLAIFGKKLITNEQRIGVFGLPNGIAVNSSRTLFVLDKQFNGIHVFKPTHFMQSVLTAVSLFNDGRYIEAIPLWNEVLHSNSNYYKANQGIGKAEYIDKNWVEAMNRAYLAKSQTNYSEAMWQYRTQWVQKYIGGVFMVLLLFLLFQLVTVKVFRFNIFRLAGKGLRLVTRKTILPVLNKVPLIKKTLWQVGYAFKVLKHPIDTFYQATYRGQGSIASAAGVFLLYVISSIASLGLTNFVFNKSGLYGVDIPKALLQYVIPILLWILGTFLVGAITKGQGTFRAIVITSVYCLIPLITLSIPLAILSNLLTLVEGVIYWFFNILLYVWTAILLFIQVKEVHGYDLAEAVKNILWILFTIAVTVIFAAAIVGIALQAYSFANEFLKELLGYV